MPVNKDPKYYPPAEERLNIISHGIGFLLSILALFLLTERALEFDSSAYLVSFSVFGGSMILLYAASTLYHSAKDHQKRAKLNILDHASIYILIAGTYTPFAVITLPGQIGNIILWTVWLIALAGVILKFFFTGKYQLLSTIMYVAMGWIIVFAGNSMLENLSAQGLWWLGAGGVSYTVGAVLFMLKNLPFNHAIFHVFVLLGTFCHFMSIYLYVV
ncbi:PAQR family membrane homeostasis protein TrhA [Christiangramia portivictoriae]|uniref:PAQR family membrane homeostasis protein TrhA n=1 Tax=Christiangramia portivictoriae TaxID=326069 RepID=UPI00040AC0EF|nr:hemolysin III family protein [Christiangramia portivictoriae]